MRLVHFKAKHVEVSFNQQDEFMCLIVSGFMRESGFQEALQQAMHFFDTLSANKVLNDFRGFKGTTPTMQKWVVENYYPTMVQQGLEYTALVLDEDIFVRYATNNVKNQVSELLTINTFHNVDMAKEWLKKQ